MTAIADVHARQIFDSRGNPTVEVDVRLESGALGRAAVPSGASTGVHEAVELRDGGEAYGGKGVTKAVANVEGEIAAAARGRDAADQAGLDRLLVELDGTAEQGPARRERDARRLAGDREGGGGGGGRLALPLPRRRGGAGAAGADDERDQRRRARRQLDRPSGVHGRPGRRASSFTEAMRIGTEIYHSLKGVLHERGLSTAVGDEGGFAPDLGSSEEAIEAILEAAERAGHRERVAIALDPAVDRVLRRRRSTGSRAGRPTATAWPTSTRGLAERYPLVSVEDGVAEDDWDGWRALTERIGDRVQLVGDDLFVTNVERLRRGIDEGVANAILVKVNQIGTLTETLDTIALARSSGYQAVISHRSGETEDTTIADLAVATGAGQIKTGAPSRTDRVAKYNQLLRIEEELGATRRVSGLDRVLARVATLREWRRQPPAAPRSSRRSGRPAARPSASPSWSRQAWTAPG